MSVDWTILPPELVQEIAEHLPIYGDYLRFLAVCPAWRSSVPHARPTHLPTQLPWLMLPHLQSSPCSAARAFFDLSTNTVHLLNLPEASHQKRHCGSSNGWLILLGETPEILMLNPLSRAKLPLPPLSSFPSVVSFNYSDIGREYSLVSPSGSRYTRSLRQMRDSFVKKAVLSSSPTRDPQFTVLAILNLSGDLAFCRSGDESWRLIEGAQSYCEDAIYFKDCFYAVDKYGAIAVCDVRGDSTSPRVSVIKTPRQFGGDMQYLVSSDDELLLVTRFLDLEFDYEPDRPHLVYRTTRFEVFKLDWVGWQWERVRNLGDRVLFIGENSSLSLSASDFPGCMANCIYYTDDYSETNYDGVFGEHDLGIYKLSDESIDSLPCYPRNTFYRLRWPPPIWVTPNPW